MELTREKFWKSKIGVILNWILVLPVFLIIGLIANIIISIGFNFMTNEDNGIRLFFEPFTKGFLIVYSALSVSSIVSPKPKIAAGVMGTLLLILIAAGGAYIFTHPHDKYYIKPINFVLNYIGITLACLAAMYYVKENE